MSCYVIEGGKPLTGELNLQGSKNSTLPILAATLLNKGISVIDNCPDITDINTATEILRDLGCKVKRQNKKITVDSSECKKYIIGEELMRKMRSSIVFLGGLLATKKQAVVCCPGGCHIGDRPIDIHISALKELGASIYEIYGSFYCLYDKGKGKELTLSYPSVGATENAMICAALTRGITVINNPAREPEIVELQKFLNKMGCNIAGAGTDKIIIKGVRSLKKYVEYTAPPDRIACVTYMSYAVLTNGRIRINNPPVEHIINEMDCFLKMGCKVNLQDGFLEIEGSKKIKPFGEITTAPFPGFPTDSQPLFCVMGTLSDGNILIENVFENRFKYAKELDKMGILTECKGNKLYIGKSKAHCGNVNACDLRGGAALVGVALMTKGISEIYDIEHIDRGYENFAEIITKLGGKIKRYDEGKKSAEGIG